MKMSNNQTQSELSYFLAKEFLEERIGIRSTRENINKFIILLNKFESEAAS